MNKPQEPEAAETVQTESIKAVVQERLVRPHAFVSGRGYAAPTKEYRSRFNFLWWFWLPRIHTQRGDTQNPRVIRLIWLCFAVGLDIWGNESRMCWPPADVTETAGKKTPTKLK
jgi:hypothetical protein